MYFDPVEDVVAANALYRSLGFSLRDTNAYRLEF